MRKTLIAALLAATLSPLAVAMPDGDHQGDRRGMHGKQPFAELDLTREQRREMGELMRQQVKARHEITQRYLDKLPQAERDTMKQELQASHDSGRKAMRDLLEPEQQKRFDEIEKKMEERRAERAEFEQWKADKAKQ